MTRIRDLVYVQLFELPSPMAHAIQIAATARALAERGLRVHLFVRGHEDAVRGLAGMGFEPPAGLHLHRVPFAHKGLAGLWYRGGLLRRLLGRDGGVVFYGRQRRQTIGVLAQRELLARKSLVVYEFHNLEHVLAQESDDPGSAGRIRAQERRLARRCDGLVAISEPLAADVAAELAPSVPLSVIPDGVDLARFLDVGSGRDPGERLRMVYAGSFYGHKGVDSLLDALALLPERFELELVGGNPPGELERLRERTCAEPALKGRVSFTGHLLPSEVPARLGAADLILLPAGAESRSQRYTSPLKLFEAMATGVPIVAARAASYESVLADGRTAFVASGASGAELARAAEHAAADPARARQVARRAMEESRDYGWERRAERIADFLEELTPVRTGLMR